MQVSPGAPPVAATVRFVALAALVAGLDQATKVWAVAALSDGPIEVIGRGVQFRLARNTGGAFSLFTGSTTVLALVGVVLVVFLVRMARRETDPGLTLGLALVLGGALGNLADRVFRDPGVLKGAVVDFIDVGAWPTFNLADSAIVIGAAILILRGWKSGEPARG